MGPENVAVKETLFEQFAKQLSEYPASYLRVSGQPFSIVFKNEPGIDAGGVFRDAISAVCAELQNEKKGKISLFVPCANRRNRVGHTIDKFVPNNSCTTPGHLMQYEMLGRLMGVAVRSNEPLQLDLPSIVWKTLVGLKPDLTDLRAIDEVLVKMMLSLMDEKDLEDRGVDSTNFVENFELVWSISDGKGEVELVPNGCSKVVEWKDRREYAEKVLAYKLGEGKEQISAIRRGLVSVIPGQLLYLWTPKEFEGMVCGQDDVDIEVLRTHTRYCGCSPSDAHVIFFWSVLSSFSQEERSLYLRFVWGRSRLPLIQNFNDEHVINLFKPPQGRDHDECLPCSHTCFFTIDLPRYSGKDVLRLKLLKAITMCSSISVA